ncbi:PQQ-dependent sugar dehydrogenase [Chiayiivirga flava]|uniref:Glucose/arabinose dehydrogenase n=1 Tax=Chiayiivirga flava TaxID=659595 RepID=A0A7W8FZE0_9GAMM|nr:PQQ-dependent sugar dehydrogenase [Chiayiivirga flava]MBB5208357.1 glucose/arabinose dehydrogenase [Chiayiivirga flava]
MRRTTLALSLSLTLGACSDPAPTASDTAPAADAATQPGAAAAEESASATPVASSGVSAPHGAPAPATPSRVEVTEFATGLENPWSLAFLPDGRMLVTERPGRLRYIAADGTLSEPIANTPAVFAIGQGGLLDVAVSPGFASDRTVYLTYAEPDASGNNAGTAAIRATLVDNALQNVRQIFRQEPKLSRGAHFGSRIVFDGNGHLFIALGENGERAASQRLDHLQGKIVRLALDGSIPADNPFVGRSDARAEIWSYGHRNQQGAALHPVTGQLWTHEHGPRGGDEINIPQRAANYGWPLATYGINYSGAPILESVGTAVAGTEQPHYYWEQSPGVSGMAFYTADRFPAWNGSLFVGSMAQRELIRLQLDGDRIVAEERLLSERRWRIRDVRQGPDGYIYVVTDEADGKVLKIGLDDA